MVTCGSGLVTFDHLRGIVGKELGIDSDFAVITHGCECAGGSVTAGSDRGEEHSFRGYGVSGIGIIKYGNKVFGFGVLSCLNCESTLGG